MSSLFPDDDQIQVGDLGSDDTSSTLDPSTDEMDAPLTPSDEAHAKHAAAVALGNPSVAPPPTEKPKRAPRKDAGKPRKKAGDVIAVEDMRGRVGEVMVNVQALPVSVEAVRSINLQVGKVVGETDFSPLLAATTNTNSLRGAGYATGIVDEIHTPEVHYDHKAIAKARLKVYGKFAARARAAAKLWPNDPARYFDVVGEIFTDLATGETKTDALRHDRLAVTDLVMGLLPKSTLEVIDCSGITVI